MNGFFTVEQAKHLNGEELLHYLTCGCICGDVGPFVMQLLAQQLVSFIEREDGLIIDNDILRDENLSLEARIDELESRE